MKRVYFARRADGVGPIKIGVSAYLDNRIHQISVDYRADFTVLASAPGDYLTERNIHLKFAANRVVMDNNKPGASEWFHPNPQLLAFIDKVRRVGKIPLAKTEQRQWVFAERYLAGETLQQIADDYGLTRERVRQVLRRIGVPSLGLRQKHRRKDHELTLVERRAAKLYASGSAPKEIIAETGLTYAQIRTAVERTGGEVRPKGYWLTKPNDAEITAKVCELYRAGRKLREIVNEVPDITGNEKIYRYLAKGDIKPRRCANRRDRVERFWQEIVADYQSGATQAALAEKYGVAVPTIRRVLVRHDALLSEEETERRRRAAVIRANHRRFHSDRIAA